MSNAALTWARKQRGMTPTYKAVLMVLADCANDQHRCWPTQASIAEEIGSTRQTVNEIVKAFAARGLLVIEGNGQHRQYRLSVGCNDAEQSSHPTLVSPQPTPSVASADTNPKEPSITQKTDAIASVSDSEAGHVRKRSAGERGSRLPVDWEPSADDADFASGLGLDARAIAGSFADYWRSCAGQKGVKLDWSATWRNWCRREAERPSRAVGGQRRGGERSSIVDILERVHIARAPGYH